MFMGGDHTGPPARAAAPEFRATSGRSARRRSPPSASDDARSDPSAQTCVTGSAGSGTTRAHPSSETTLMPSTRTSSAPSSVSCSIRVRMIRPFCSMGVGTSPCRMGMGGVASTISAREVGLVLEERHQPDQGGRGVEGGQEGREDVPAPLVGGEGHAARCRGLEQPRRRQRRQHQLDPAARDSGARCDRSRSPGAPPGRSPRPRSTTR